MKRLVSLATVVLALAGCASQNLPLAPSKAAVPDYKYLIGPGDNLNIIVWRNPELSMAVPVRPLPALQSARKKEGRGGGRGAGPAGGAGPRGTHKHRTHGSPPRWPQPPRATPPRPRTAGAAGKRVAACGRTTQSNPLPGCPPPAAPRGSCAPRTGSTRARARRRGVPQKTRASTARGCGTAPPRRSTDSRCPPGRP